MLEGVELALLTGQGYSLAIAVHQVPEGPPVNWDLPVGNEKSRGLIITGAQVRAQKLQQVGLQGIDPREGTLEPLD